MANLRQFLAEEKKLGKTIYPPAAEYFNALNTTPLNKVKVVILGTRPVSRCRSSTWFMFFGA
jgi:uracil-DNA glycosylase